MHPVLFTVAGHAVGSHPFFVALGALAAAGLFALETRRRGLHDERLFWIAVAGLFAGGVAAKLATAWRYVAIAPDPTFAGALVYGGRSILGGLAGAYVGVLVAKRVVGWRGSTGDLFAPGVALGMAVGRVGCLLSEQVGTPTRLPWGVSLSPAQAARIPNCPAYCAEGVPMHPSFVYEIAFHLAMFALLAGPLRRRPHEAGDLFKLYLLAYAVFRFGVEFVRDNDVWLGGLTRSQLFLLPTSLLLAWHFARRAHARPRRAGLEVAA